MESKTQGSKSLFRRASAKVASASASGISKAARGISKAATYLDLNPYTAITKAKDILKKRYAYYMWDHPSDFTIERSNKILKWAEAILDNSKRVKLMALYKTPEDLANYASNAAFDEEQEQTNIVHDKIRASMTHWNGGKKKGKSRKSSKSSKTRKNRKTRSRK